MKNATKTAEAESGTTVALDALFRQCGFSREMAFPPPGERYRQHSTISFEMPATAAERERRIALERATIAMPVHFYTLETSRQMREMKGGPYAALVMRLDGAQRDLMVLHPARGCIPVYAVPFGDASNFAKRDCEDEVPCWWQLMEPG